jgi:hypothetical protein
VENELYKECLERSRSYDRRNSFWPELAEKHGYENTERLRKAFRDERDRRNDKVSFSTFDVEKYPVVVFDIETLPMRGSFWSPKTEYISPAQVQDDWILLSWAAKDLMSGEVRSEILTPREAVKRNDKRIVGGLWNEFNRASIMIGHNIRSFDIPMANTRFISLGLKPYAPFRTVDTYIIATKNFRFSYNRMAWICKQLGLREKIENDGFPLWLDCADGKQDALDEMQKYNIGDVQSGQELYLTLRPWDRSHPNIGLFYDDVQNGHCKNCGSTSLVKLDKPDFTPTGVYTAKRCGECGAINRVAKSNTSKAKRESLLR